MEKYLFNDGMNGVREVQSREELQQLAENTDSRLAKVWVYSSNEWISLAEFRTLFPAPAAQKRNGTAKEKGLSQNSIEAYERDVRRMAIFFSKDLGINSPAKVETKHVEKFLHAMPIKNGFYNPIIFHI